MVNWMTKDTTDPVRAMEYVIVMVVCGISQSNIIMAIRAVIRVYMILMNVVSVMVIHIFLIVLHMVHLIMVNVGIWIVMVTALANGGSGSQMTVVSVTIGMIGGTPRLRVNLIRMSACQGVGQRGIAEVLDLSSSVEAVLNPTGMPPHGQVGIPTTPVTTLSDLKLAMTVVIQRSS